jgi:hypothetical protein
MFVAGMPVRDELILELARVVDEDALADKFAGAYGRDAKVLALDIPERETILVALDYPPAGLAELGAVRSKSTCGGSGRAAGLLGND